MATPPLPAFSEMIEHAPDAIVLVDGAGAIVYANRRVADLFGMTPHDLIGQPVELLIPERFHERHLTNRDGYARDPAIRPMGDSRVQLAGRRADGSEFPVDIHLAPILGSGQQWTLGVIRDATERHRFLDELRSARQLAEQVVQVKGEFLALAAHDLSQPVQNLEFVIAAIERTVPPDSDIAELTALAAASTARMRELLKMLMEISRLESGTMQVVSEPVRMVDIFGDIERQFGPVAQSKALRFENEPCLHIVETDPRLLRGMLSNLVANAIRYTDKGEVRIRCDAPLDGSLQLAVSDTGIGIPSDQYQSIFQDFNRLDEGRRTHREGFGLGLGIVRRLSNLLGFSIAVDSAVGRGSTFRVEIPSTKVYHAA